MHGTDTADKPLRSIIRFLQLVKKQTKLTNFQKSEEIENFQEIPPPFGGNWPQIKPRFGGKKRIMLCLSLPTFVFLIFLLLLAFTSCKTSNMNKPDLLNMLLSSNLVSRIMILMLKCPCSSYNFPTF